MSGRIALAGVGRKPQRSKNKAAAPSPASVEPAAALPHLPHDLLTFMFRELEVQDLCRCAQVAKHWRQTIYEQAEAGFQQCFTRDYGMAAAAELAGRKTWRDKYIAYTIDKCCHALRDKTGYLDELEDTSAALERSLQRTLTSLNQLDRTVSHRRWDLNQLVGEVAGRASTRADSALGREIVAAARAELDPAGAREGQGSEPAQEGGEQNTESRAAGQNSGGGSSSTGLQEDTGVLFKWEGWRGRLTKQVCWQLVEDANDVEFWEESLKEQKVELKALMDALAYVSDSIRAVRQGVQELRHKKDSLEAATSYRHTMRRA